MPDSVEKGITITFRGDSISFDNTVANINKSIQLLKNETARLNRELKLDPTNIDLIKQRFQALTQVQELSAKQLNTYREYLYEAMGAKGQANIEKNVAGFKELKERIANAEIQAEDLRKQMTGLVDANGIITNTEKWKALRAEQTKVNFELDSLTQELITAATLTENGIADRKKWDDTVRMVKSLSGSLEDAEKHLTTMSEKFLRLSETYQGLDNLEKKLNAISDTFGKISKATAGLSADAWKNLTASAKAAIEFEEAFAGIKKTVDETATTSYQDLMLSIREMSKEIPVTAAELSKIGEIAGQLGIKADDLMEFTRVVADLGATTNVSGQEAATMIAQLFNITSKGDFSNLDRFASALVHLGNNAATDEKTILELTTRLAAAGKNANMTQYEMLALSTAMASVGLNAESGGSAISRIMQDISKAISLGGAYLKKWSYVAGISADEFKKRWRTDALGTLSLVIKRIGTLADEKTPIIELLTKLGISNIRTIDTMQRLVAAGDAVDEMLSLSKEGWSENVALTIEAEKRYATVQSRLTILKNTFTDMAYSLGEVMLPYISQFVDWLQQLLNKFTSLDEVQRKIILVMGLVTAAISPVAKAISYLTGENGLAGLIKKLKDFAGSEGFGGKIAQWVGGLGNLTSGVSLLTAGIAGLAAILALSFLTNEEVRNSLVQTWAVVKEKLSPVIDFLFGLLKEIWNYGVTLLSPLINALINLGTQIWGVITSIIEVVAGLIAVIFGPDALGGVLKGLWDEILKPLVDWLIGPLISALSDIINWISSIIGWVGKAIDKFKEFIGIKSKAGDTSALSMPATTGAIAGARVATPIASGSFGINPSAVGRLQMASGGGNTLSLTTNINVNNNGTPIDESVVRRWGNVITDIVSDNLGRRW